MDDRGRRRAYLIQYLMDHERATLRELAEVCGVSARTIQRDITILTPLFMISSDQGYNGAHYLVDKAQKESNRLTAKQVVVLNELIDVVTEEQAQVLHEIIDKFWTYRWY